MKILTVKNILLLAILMVLPVSAGAQKQRGFLFFKKKYKKENQEPEDGGKSGYEKLFNKEHKTAGGLIMLHLMDGKAYFEFPVNLFGKEMLIGSTVSNISDNANATIGSKPTAPLHAVFDRNRTHVQLREVNTGYMPGDENTGEALRKGLPGAVLAHQKILAYNSDSTAVVFEMTDFFLGDNKSMPAFDRNSPYGRLKRTEKYIAENSYISDIKAFDDNLSIKSCLSYTFSVSDRAGKELIKDRPFTAEMTRSIMLLKEKPYRPRPADYRIGVFHTKRNRLGEDSRTTAPVYYANRWEVQPSDTVAWQRGEKVAPVKQIVFYIDNTFPGKWKPYIREGVTQWNELFEKIGFRDVMVARNFPENDPEFDPDNIKYSCIRYAPSTIKNAMGPSWTDPRSGEILTASVYVYHNVIKLVSGWLFIQTAGADENVRTVNIPDEILGDALRYVIAHEIGHCLGFMHNMSGSSVIPVDSLRSPSFTQKYGTTASIMDYARFNYVAQPGDKEKGVTLTPPRFGVYDEYLVRWAYTPVFGINSIEEEEKVTAGWITDALRQSPYYRYGKQQFYGFADPRSLAEDLGDDAIKATRYGIANLKYILQNMDGWLAGEDDTYEHRTELLAEIVGQMALYTGHIANNIGGCYMNEVKTCDTMPPFAPLPADYQRKALGYLFEIYNDLDWLDDNPLLAKIPVTGSPKRTLQSLITNTILNRIFMVSKYEQIGKEPFRASEALDMFYDFVWQPVVKGQTLTESQMSLQKQYIYGMAKMGGFKMPGPPGTQAISDVPGMGNLLSGHSCYSPNTPSMDDSYSPVSGFEWRPDNRYSNAMISQADIYAYISKAQGLLKRKVAGASGKTKAHYELLLKTLEMNIK